MNRSERNELAYQALLTALPSQTGWYRANCPFCPEKLGKVDTKRAFSILVTKGVYHCFRCGTAGSLSEDAVPQEMREAVLVAGLQPPATTATTPPEGYYALAEEPACSALSFEEPREYLLTRVPDMAIWKETKIGACISGRQDGRVIVPILAPDGETWLGWVGRLWSKSSERTYMYPVGMRRGEILFNQKVLAEEVEEPVLVVEGVFDALALWPRAVALLGKPSEMQVEALLAAKRPVAVVLDGDAWQEGWALAMRLRMDGQRAGSVKLPPRIDPDEVEKDWLFGEAKRCLDEAA